MSKLRTPLTYYGGKQKLCSVITSLIPKHILYSEPFLGGAAVFFSKDPSEVEVINDTNAELVNFYRVCKNRFHDLQALVRVTLHSRKDHDDAWVIYNKPHLFDEVRRAWAVWVLSSQSFSAKLDGSWGFDKKKGTTTRKIESKKDLFLEDLAFRLQGAQIECADAIYIIQSRDGADSFFYCDPPYFNSDMGHYDGYSEDDFKRLLEALSGLQGKFLLSSYPSPVLKEFTARMGWQTRYFDQGVSVNAKGGYIKRKTEVLTANYPI